MTLKNVKEWRTADRRIPEVLKNLPMDKSFDEQAQTHPGSSKRRRMWTFFVIGLAAGVVFVLLFFR